MNEGGTFLDGIFDADRLTAAKAKTKIFSQKIKRAQKVHRKKRKKKGLAANSLATEIDLAGQAHHDAEHITVELCHLLQLCSFC
jgi:hypothetical protein